MKSIWLRLGKTLFLLGLVAVFALPTFVTEVHAVDLCEKPVDVVLVLDYSGSVAAEQPSIVAFATGLVSRFTLAPDVAQFGVVRYADTSIILSGLVSDANAVNAAIAATPNIGYLTNIEAGLLDAGTVMAASRPGVPHVAVHLTDGLYNLGSDPIYAAQGLNTAGIHIFGVDYGNYGDYVTRISNIVFPTGGLGIDQLTGIINALAGAICDATVTVPPLGSSIPGSDNRINPAHGDLEAPIYSGSDADGNPAVLVYCVDDNSNGYPEFSVTAADVNAYPEYPPTNVEVKRATTCDVDVIFYILTTGEYQINIGPFTDGKVFEVTFTGLYPQNVHFNEFNVFN